MEISIYTNSGCQFCKQTKDRLDENGYTYKEYTVSDNPEVWHKVKTDAMAYMFPTLKVNGRYLMPSRDFINPGQLITVLEDIEKYGNERDERIFSLEMLKNIHFQFVSTQQVGKMCNCDKPICPNPEDQVPMPRMGDTPVVGGPEIDPSQLQ